MSKSSDPRWRVFYGDGSTFTDRDGTWAEAPDDDVQVVMLYEGRAADGSPLGTILMGLDEYVIPGHRKTKRGRWMDPDAYRQIVERALEQEHEVFHTDPADA